ncbi:Peptidyl-prolyl cis-trans isomerase B [Nostocoides japonicum T1-X7]|uniref:Peptidyl-prolyl cis-trans isomerase B n=1 Tax=Nostocoides japonicum T1-X7 TaxID=1194083 RepID=A0A077M2C4_9MICO|nr:peptidylprolyl isomerase [Tetrasphaera japonica]CCH78379.1 Peptidyl-prolyl cis-trans isomerase B [Tetrasphaera japonica T1-X7]
MTKAQERARARRRYEKREAARIAKEAQRKRDRVVVAVVVCVLVLVAGFVVLARQLSGSSNEASTPSGSATSTTVAGCQAPPSPLGTNAELSLPSKKTAEGKTFVATLTTNCGDIQLTLDGSKAPQAVASFNQLAEKDYWRDSPCHRLTTSGYYILQCGDPTGTGQGTPGYGFGVENAPKDGKYPRGTVAMARTSDVKKGNGGQFFLVYKDTELPGGYTIFGTVTKGMDIVDKIAAAGVSGGGTDGTPAAPISILRVSVTEKKG